MAAATFFSPPSTSSISRVPGSANQASDFISPSVRRIVSESSPATFGANESTILEAQNDDAREKHERRRSRMAEMQRRHMASPATPAERRRSQPLGGLSSVQLTDHYTNCIKLSAENKINAKNAFGLHLIDYMAELMPKKDLSNFQVASSTLDASAKIYAGRVDAIHSQTYKLLTGLGRPAEDKHGSGDELGEGEGEDAATNEKKRKRVSKRKIIETNLDNITVKTIDMEFEVDPLFQKMSAIFDEGGSGGLLLNQLRCLDDSSELVFDSNTVVMGHESASPRKKSSALKAVHQLTEKLLKQRLDDAVICPSFADFEFGNWDRSTEDSFSAPGNTSNAFDMEAEPEPIVTGSQDETADVPHDDFDDFGAPADDDDGAGETLQGQQSSDDITIGEGKAAQMVQSAMKNLTDGSIGDLMQVLTFEPSEYSYFNSTCLRTWAGPGYWKMLPKLKDAAAAGDTKKKRPKKKKVPTATLR